MIGLTMLFVLCWTCVGQCDAGQPLPPAPPPPLSRTVCLTQQLKSTMIRGGALSAACFPGARMRSRV